MFNATAATEIYTLTLHDALPVSIRIIIAADRFGRLRLSAYIRKMALDGYCLHLDLKELQRMAYLLQMCSNNLNQYAKRANECGKVYAADMEDLRQRLDELIDIGKQILSKLAEL